MASIVEACAEAQADSGAGVVGKFRPVKIAVFGSGSFGTALAVVLARNGHEVCILTRRKDVESAVSMEHKNPCSPIPDMVLPFNVAATTDAKKALAGAAYIVHSIPVQSSREYLEGLRDLIPHDAVIINSSKGLHCETLQLMTDLIPAALGRDTNPVVCLSGPTFAQELIKGFPSGAVAACADLKMAEEVARLFNSPTMRVWTSGDVVGVELAGALKNVYAIAAGALEGLGLGLNTTAMLCTRAIAEMTTLAVVLGGQESTLAGLSGVGDMVLTCFGKLSRNRTVGVRLGKGERLSDVMGSMTEVAEGVATAPAALKLAHKHGVTVPIVEAVVSVLSGAVESPLPALMALLSLPLGEERLTGATASFASALASMSKHDVATSARSGTSEHSAMDGATGISVNGGAGAAPTGAGKGSPAFVATAEEREA